MSHPCPPNPSTWSSPCIPLPTQTQYLKYLPLPQPPCSPVVFPPLDS